MQIEADAKYKRRGQVCCFTFRLTWGMPLKDSDGADYTESWHWAYLKWDGVDWQVGQAPRPQRPARWSHACYPPPCEPEMDDLRLALHLTVVECRALKAMGAAK